MGRDRKCWTKIPGKCVSVCGYLCKSTLEISRKTIVTLVYLIVLSVVLPDAGGHVVVMFQLGRTWKDALLGSIRTNYQITRLMPSRSSQSYSLFQQSAHWNVSGLQLIWVAGVVVGCTSSCGFDDERERQILLMAVQQAWVCWLQKESPSGLPLHRQGEHRCLVAVAQNQACSSVSTLASII